MNDSTVAPVPSDFINVGYSVFGTSAMVTNIFTFVVLLSNKKLLRRSALPMGISISHFLCGLGIGVHGLHRWTHKSQLSLPVTPWECIQLVYPVFNPLAFQSMTTMLILVGVERALAIMFGNWYKQHWTPPRAWMAVACGYIYVLIPIGYGLSCAWAVNTKSTTLSCGLTAVYGLGLVNWNFGATVFAGITAVTLTMAGYRYDRRRIAKLPLISGERGRLKKQAKLTKALLSVACLDFILVVIPNIFSFLTNATGIWPTSISGYFNILYCLNATVTIYSYIAFNSEFRQTAAKILHLHKCAPLKTSSVAPNGNTVAVLAQQATKT